MPRKPAKPPLRDPDPPQPVYEYRLEPEPEVIPPAGRIDYMAMLRELSAAPLSKGNAILKADILMLAAAQDGQYAASNKALELQIRIAGYLVERIESDVRISLTPEERKARIMELLERAQPANRNKRAG